MKFYNEDPSLAEVTMCTVLECNPDTGFIVNLDEYDREGFLMLRELSSKKIKTSVASFLKVGTSLPLQIIDIDDTQICLSKKDVKKDEKKRSTSRFGLNQKLFNLAKRLSIITKTNQERWEQQFRDCMDVDIEDHDHPFVLIQNRRIGELEDFDQELQDLIDQHHARLFGITPVSQNFNFTIHSFGVDGMQKIKDLLIGIRDEYGEESSKDELYENHNLANIKILPLAIPSFQLQITAYQKAKCVSVGEKIKSQIQEAKLDYCVFD